jgi:hypothetical protein
VSLRRAWGKLPRNAEINQHHFLSTRVQDDILGLNIPVQQVILMHHLQRCPNLPDIENRRRLW